MTLDTVNTFSFLDSVLLHCVVKLYNNIKNEAQLISISYDLLTVNNDVVRCEEMIFVKLPFP